MPAPNKQLQGLLASALLIIVLAIATFFSTEDRASQLRSYVSTNYVPDTASSSRKSRKRIDDYERWDKGASLPTDDEMDDIYSAYGEGEEIAIRGNFYESIDQNDDEAVDEDYDDHVDDVYYEIGKAILDADDDQVLNKLSSRYESTLGSGAPNKTNNDEAVKASPACHPHFNLALPNNRWNNTTKFKRIYFYHARKAGGSTMHKYLAKVAEHYGLELRFAEWSGMEEPGTNDDGATFYVTHLRDPVSRSISHFKYQGRWDCKDLVGGTKRGTFTPTEDNANKIETWNQTGGHVPFKCRVKKSKKTKQKFQIFSLGSCAVNCYTQWFTGICPDMGVSLHEQYQVARARVMRFNFVAVIEKLRDPRYVQAVEDFFGVPGLNAKGSPFCERQSHKANAKNPLIVRNDTRAQLERLNEADGALYHELGDCLDSGQYDFPKWDPNRFELYRYNATEAKAALKEAKAQKIESNNS